MRTQSRMHPREIAWTGATARRAASPGTLGRPLPPYLEDWGRGYFSGAAINPTRNRSNGANLLRPLDRPSYCFDQIGPMHGLEHIGKESLPALFLKGFLFLTANA